MANLQYYTYEGFGEIKQKETWYSQAVRIGDRVELSGQGGWDNKTSVIATGLDKQIELAFDNIERALHEAGLAKGLAHVFKLRTYHVGWTREHLDILVAHLKKRFPNHQPILTVLGIEQLALPEMLIEIEAEASVSGA